ncbi:MAG: OstA-like protein [Bacteroidales bacterium]
MMHKLLFLILGVFCATLGVAQDTPKKMKIEIRRADYIEFDENIGNQARRIVGDVLFEHNQVLMHCDSAYSYPTNKIEAFGNVHVNQGDTLHMYGDYLEYDGNTNNGKVKYNVRLRDDETLLVTDTLYFNSRTSIANYLTGGTITNKDQQLDSRIGFYYSSRKIVHFKDSVRITTPDYLVKTDTLKYNLSSETAYFLGPTEMFSEEHYLYCERGNFKANEKTFQCEQNVYYKNGSSFMWSDFLFYNDSLDYGWARQNVRMEDTVERVIMTGHYAYYKQEPEMGYVTDSALMIIYDEKDSLFLHADTLYSNVDSTGEEHVFKAYKKAQFYRSDLQGRCDSLVYQTHDSSITMYQLPVLWSGQNQITAAQMTFYLKDEAIDRFEMGGNALIISKEDTSNYNQLRGKVMKGFFRQGDLRRVDVFGNAQSIYFTRDKEELIGINQAESSDMRILMVDSQVTSVNMILKPDGTMYPVGQLEETKLSGFEWLEPLRPISPKSVFIWK